MQRAPTVDRPQSASEVPADEGGYLAAQAVAGDGDLPQPHPLADQKFDEPDHECGDQFGVLERRDRVLVVRQPAPVDRANVAVRGQRPIDRRRPHPAWKYHCLIESIAAVALRLTVALSHLRR